MPLLPSVCQTHPAFLPTTQLCTAWFWAAGVWVAKLGRRKEKRDICELRAHLGTHVCPRSMCPVPAHMPWHR